MLSLFSFERNGRVEFRCLKRDKARFNERVLVHYFIGFFPAFRFDDDHASVVAPLAGLHKHPRCKLLFCPFPVQEDRFVDLRSPPDLNLLIDMKYTPEFPSQSTPEN